MKTKILFLMSVLLAWVTSLPALTTREEAPEFAPIGSEWYYTYTFGCCPENHFNHIVSEKDTIVEENNCRVLRQYFDNSNIASEKYIIKQEQGKVYYYYQNQFNLLFDFDAEVNDIVEFTFMYKKYYDNDFPFGKDTIFSARFRVESVSTNAQNLKMFTTKVFEEDMLDFWGILVPPFLYYSYTEKIGLQNLLGSPLHSGFIPVLDNVPHPAMQDYRWLRCYSSADFSYISDGWATTSLPCNYSITTDINSSSTDENIKIYHSHFNDNVFVFINNGGNIEIIDVSGKVVYNSKLSNGINEISTSHFLEGIYLVKIQNKDNIIQTFKLVKP